MHWYIYYSYSRQFVPRKLRFLKKCFFFFFLSFQIEDFKTSITSFLLSSILLQSSKSSSCTKFHKRQNARKGRYFMADFWKKCKKVKNEVTGTEKRRFWLIYLKTFHESTFLGPVTSILTFFAVFSKMHQTISTLPVISYFMKIFVTQSSITLAFLQLLKS